MSNLRAARAFAAAFVASSTFAAVLAASPALAADADRHVDADAVFTGRYVDGAPVYRLPTVTVAVSRKDALAKIEQEERNQKSRARLALNQPRK